MFYVLKEFVAKYLTDHRDRRHSSGYILSKKTVANKVTNRSMKFKDVLAQNVPTNRLIFKLATKKCNDLLLPKGKKKWGVTDLVLERACPKKHPKSEKIGLF